MSISEFSSTSSTVETIVPFNFWNRLRAAVLTDRIPESDSQPFDLHWMTAISQAMALPKRPKPIIPMREVIIGSFKFDQESIILNHPEVENIP